LSFLQLQLSNKPKHVYTNCFKLIFFLFTTFTTYRYYRFDEGSGTITLDHTPVDPPDVDVPHDGSMAEGSTAPTYVVSWAPFESCVLRCSMQGACRVKNVDGKYSKRRERASRNGSTVVIVIVIFIR